MSPTTRYSVSVLASHSQTCRLGCYKIQIAPKKNEVKNFVNSSHQKVQASIKSIPPFFRDHLRDMILAHGHFQTATFQALCFVIVYLHHQRFFRIAHLKATLDLSHVKKLTPLFFLKAARSQKKLNYKPQIFGASRPERNCSKISQRVCSKRPCVNFEGPMVFNQSNMLIG